MSIAILQGIAIGFGLAFLIGPVFFTLISTSINSGTKSAVYLAIGISLSDVFFIAITLLGLTRILENEAVIYYLGLLGGVILLGFGIQSMLRKTKITFEHNKTLEPKQKLKKVIKGFILNSLHPGVILFWLATVGGILAKSDFTLVEIILLFTSTIATTFCMDLLKIHLAGKFRTFITDALIRKINISVGIILIVCGLYLLYKTYLGEAIAH